MAALLTEAAFFYSNLWLLADIYQNHFLSNSVMVS